MPFHLYKGQPGALKAPACAWSGKGSHHLVYCMQPYPVFTQEAISRTCHFVYIMYYIYVWFLLWF